MLSLVLNCIDRLNVYTTAAHFAEFAGGEAAESWKEIVNLLYEILGKGPQSGLPLEHPRFPVLWDLTPLSTFSLSDPWQSCQLCPLLQQLGLAGQQAGSARGLLR